MKNKIKFLFLKKYGTTLRYRKLEREENSILGKCQNVYSLECLTAIYDQVAKPLSCTDKFAYDHPYQA